MDRKFGEWAWSNLGSGPPSVGCARIVSYIHHNPERPVFVNKELKGKHREHCLCNRCGLFKPNTEDNCKIARSLYALCKEYDLVTPVWECPYWIAVAGHH